MDTLQKVMPLSNEGVVIYPLPVFFLRGAETICFFRSDKHVLKKNVWSETHVVKSASGDDPVIRYFVKSVMSTHPRPAYALIASM